MARAWSLVVTSVLVPLSLLAGPVQPRGGKTPAPGLMEIAGEYYLGEGLGVNRTLVINPDGTFSHRSSDCMGTYARVAGRASLRGGELVLEPMPEPRFVPVRWGERRYLISPDRLVAFTNAINQGYEPRSYAHGSVYLRKGDWDKPVTGRPDLPASCRAYLLPRPVETQVLLKRDRRTVEVGAGRSQGLLPGMWLVSLETTERLPLCDLEVLSVEEDTAVAKGDEDCEALQPGHRVATRWSKSDDPAHWPLEVK